MDHEESIGDGTLHYLASVVADGTATPDEARRLLVHFVRDADQGIVRPRMLEHFRDCISAFLNGRKVLLHSAARESCGVLTQTMDKAFGLTRVSAGQPPQDDDTSCYVALRVLEKLLSGSSLEDAAGDIACTRKAAGLPVSSETQIRAAWADKKMDAWVWLRFLRSFLTNENAPTWSNEELSRLTKIYKNESRFVPPLLQKGEDQNCVSLTPENLEDKPA